MAGTVTITEEVVGTIKKITFDWLSSAGGAADGTTTRYYSGVIERVVLKPDSGGTQPSDAYDVTITDDDSVDVLDGAGADCSQTNPEQIVAGVGAIANTQLTLAVTNAGNAKGGLAIVYLR